MSFEIEREETPDRTVVRVHIPASLSVRIQRLIDEEQLGFTSLQHFVSAALRSFVSYKEHQIGEFDAEGRKTR